MPSREEYDTQKAQRLAFGELRYKVDAAFHGLTMRRSAYYAQFDKYPGCLPTDADIALLQQVYEALLAVTRLLPEISTD